MIKLKNFLRRIQTKIYLALITILVTGLIILNSYTNYLHKTINASNDKTLAIYVISDNKELAKDLSKLDKVKKVQQGIIVTSEKNILELYKFSTNLFDNHTNEAFLFPNDKYDIKDNAALFPMESIFGDEQLSTDYQKNINKTFDFSSLNYNTNLKVQGYYKTVLPEILINKNTFKTILKNSSEYIYRLTLKDYSYYNKGSYGLNLVSNIEDLEVLKDIKKICSDCETSVGGIGMGSILLDNHMTNFLLSLDVATDMENLVFVLTYFINIINKIFFFILLIIIVNVIIDENKYIVIKRKLGYNITMIKKDLIEKIIFLLITSILISIFLSLILKLILNHYFHLQMIIFSYLELLSILKYCLIISILSFIFIQIKYRYKKINI